MSLAFNSLRTDFTPDTPRVRSAARVRARVSGTFPFSVTMPASERTEMSASFSIASASSRFFTDCLMSPSRASTSRRCPSETTCRTLFTPRTPSVPRAICSAANFSSAVRTFPRSVTTRSSVSTVTAVAFTRLSAKSRAFVFDVSHVSLTGESSATARPGPHTMPAIAMQIATRFMVSLLSSAATAA